MSRITKQLSEQIATKLVEKKLNQIKEMQNKFSETLFQHMKKSVDKNLIKFYEKNKEFFKTTSSFRFAGNGFNHETFYMSDELPCVSNYPTVIPDNEIGKIARSFRDNEEKMKLEIKKLKIDIVNSLINLRTYANIEKEFPEAFKLIPKDDCTAIAINIKEVRSRL